MKDSTLKSANLTKFAVEITNPKEIQRIRFS